MNQGQDLACYVYLGGFVVRHWTAAQEVASSNNTFNCKSFFVTECNKFFQKNLGKTQIERKISKCLEFSESDHIKEMCMNLSQF